MWSFINNRGCRAFYTSLYCLIIVSCSESLHEFDSSVLKQTLCLDSNLNIKSEYIVVIGDIQEYTAGKGYDFYYNTTVNWILSQHIQGIDIKCVLQLGDLTNYNAKEQYNVFYHYTLPMAEEVPYIACIGNHDYMWDKKGLIHNRYDTYFSDFVSFSLTDSLVLARFESGRMENVVVKNYIDGNPYYILVLEFGPRIEVLKWADAYIKSHRDCKFILMTHEFLNNKGERIAYNSTAEAQFRNTTWSSPEQVWQKLVKDNDNILCVICGHNGFSNHLFSENSIGRQVPQILFNLQYQKNGGNGLIQLWEFPHGSDTVYIRTYSTLLQQWYADDDTHKFNFNYKY